MSTRHEELLEAQHRQAAATERVAWELQERRRREERERDAAVFEALRRPPRQIFDAGGLLRAIPGLAAQFSKEVPASHRDGRVIRCVCGGETTLGRSVTSCTGGCGRYFVGDEHGAFCAGAYPVDDDVELEPAA